MLLPAPATESRQRHTTESNRQQRQARRLGSRGAGWEAKALFMTVWWPSTRSAEKSCGIRQG